MMLYQKIEEPGQNSAGVVLVSSITDENRVIGDVLALQNCAYELVLDTLPGAGERVHIKFNNATPAGRRHLAALIETGSDEVRVEIGQVDIEPDATAEIHIFGDPGFRARLVF